MNMKVANRKCIRHISFQSMKTARTRNIVAILAIALTAVLFTALFTIAMSISYSFEQSTFRQVGGYAHGGFKSLTKEQFEELRDAPLIKEWGVRRFVGMPSREPFTKSHVEVSWCDEKEAAWMFLEPIEGRFPKEGTNEAATDTAVLALLGVEPEIGAEFTMTFNVDGTETTETFTLCGYWEYDEAIIANHVLIPESRVDEILDKLNTQCEDGMTGLYNMDVMFKSPAHIENDLLTILEQYGYQSENPSEKDTYINIGVNWGYISAQLSDDMDFETIFSIAAILLLIIFTGYLIIYNVFQISVSNDIRFYGLLKTIGTTGRQIKRIIFQQAILLSAIGIPIGLLIGYGIGAVLTPIVLSNLDGIPTNTLSISPWIFIGSVLFSLVTVMISCRKPGKIAAKVSPVEAVRYTEGRNSKKTKRKAKSGASICRMAWANLGRNRKKTVITVISLSLAVVLLNITVTFTSGFDMNKYVSNRMTTDFMFADAGYFQVTGSLWNADMALPEEVISSIEAQGGIAEGGRTYGKCSSASEFVTEEYYRKLYGRWESEENLNLLVERAQKENGLIQDTVQLYGMEPFCLDNLNLLEGDITKLYGDGNYIAAVYTADDYGNIYPDSHWARLGDKVTIRYTEEWEYYNPETGEVYDPDNIPSTAPYAVRSVKYRDVEYEVAALVDIPSGLSYRYYGSDEFVMAQKPSKGIPEQISLCIMPLIWIKLLPAAILLQVWRTILPASRKM